MKGRFAERFFKTDDGLTLYCRDYPAPTPSAPTVVCLHGLSRNSRDFQDLAPVLNERFRVVVPEQRGRGRSDYDTVTSRYNLMQYVHDTHAMLAEFDCDKISVIGTSMGGLMAFALNALYPHVIQRLVINDIGPDINAAGLERIQSYVGVAGPFADWEEATAYVMSVSRSFLTGSPPNGRRLLGSAMSSEVIALWQIMTHGLVRRSPRKRRVQTAPSSGRYSIPWSMCRRC